MTIIDLAQRGRPAARVTAVGSRSPRVLGVGARDLTGTLAGALLVWVTALWVRDGGLQDLTSLGSALTSVGRVTGLWASALLLLQVGLMARVPWVERAWGQDALTRAHRVVGFTSFTLMMAHLVLITLGYAADSTLGLWGTIVDFTLNYPGMLLALAGTGALVLVVLTSVKAARARMRYESWHLLHLYAYLGAGLALPHQLWTGAQFVGHTLTTVFWWFAYAVTLALVIGFRVVLPLWRSLRAPIRVLSVRPEGPNATSVTVGGPGVARWAARGGQYFTWRFLDGPGWSAGKPYSLSAAPDGRTWRITVAHVGPGSARTATLRPGTRVLLEGPYGRLHAGVATREQVVLLASGIGITPMRAILEDLDRPAGAVTVIHRVRSRAEAILSDEIAALARARGARYLLVEGPRVRGRASWLPQQAAHLSDADALRQLAPGIAHADVFVCGSTGWLDAATAAVRTAGTPSAHLHSERFTG